MIEHEREKVVSLREVMSRIWRRRKLAVLIILTVFSTLVGLMAIRASYVATSVLAIGSYCESVNYPTFRPVESSDDTELYIKKSFLKTTGLDRQCTVAGTTSNEPIVSIACTGNTAQEAKEHTLRLANAILERHRKMFEIEGQYANHHKMELLAKKERIARRIKNLPQRRVMEMPEALVPLLRYQAELEEGYADLDRDIQLTTFRRQFHRQSKVDPTTINVDRQEIERIKILGCLVVAFIFGMLMVFSLALGEALRYSGSSSAR